MIHSISLWKKELAATLEWIVTVAMVLLIGVSIVEVLRLDAVRRFFDIGWLAVILAVAAISRAIIHLPPDEFPHRSFGRRLTFVIVLLLAYAAVIQKYGFTMSMGAVMLLITVFLGFVDNTIMINASDDD